MILTWYPAIPPWDGMHPAVVQFPLVLLLAAPLIALVGLFVRPAGRTLAWTALAVMGLGTIALWLAVGTGHAGGQLVERTPELQRLLSQHEALGTSARLLFTVLTLVYALLLVLPAWLRRGKPLPLLLQNGLAVVFLALYIACTGVLAQASNAGGHLVHQYGLRAMVQPPDTVSAPVADVTQPQAAPRDETR